MKYFEGPLKRGNSKKMSSYIWLEERENKATRFKNINKHERNTFKD